MLITFLRANIIIFTPILLHVLIRKNELRCGNIFLDKVKPCRHEQIPSLIGQQRLRFQHYIPYSKVSYWVSGIGQLISKLK